ncbi:hypothetical protein CABS01_00348 [Colletotrichum abscissum]|uniref:Uncharacterized protein n=1 Tax=Colletotrichum abscissum TaxID=1671311 RepID=A0A9P9X1V1_9PEZI|nr:uncharacterized protein CABS01_00348 [Colletotrichum abscissum]KAI3531914.1 hypothetical protein CABS02_14020 [Colletotrichum abscissum]KAK1525259.1 hypothetical protein CABS01_00348 [Colletotrichum abscissum]
MAVNFAECAASTASGICGYRSSEIGGRVKAKDSCTAILLRTQPPSTYRERSNSIPGCWSLVARGGLWWMQNPFSRVDSGVLELGSGTWSETGRRKLHLPSPASRHVTEARRHSNRVALEDWYAARPASEGRRRSAEECRTDAPCVP